MDWVKQYWPLILAGATIFSTFTLYGYRIQTLEAQVAKNQDSISFLTSTNTDVQISLAKIQTDLEYIKVQITKLTQ